METPVAYFPRPNATEFEILEAYADSNRTEDGFKRRNLQFRSGEWIELLEALRIMKQAVPDGYNVFRAELIYNLPLGSKLQVAREFSVCLYVKTTKPMANAIARMEPDEVSEVSPGEWRLWWD